MNTTLATLIEHVLGGENKPSDISALFHAKNALLKAAGIDPMTGNPLKD